MGIYKRNTFFMKIDGIKDEIIYRLYRRQEPRSIVTDLIERRIIEENDEFELLKEVNLMREAVEKFRIKLKKTK
jgi:hypothetical protein